MKNRGATLTDREMLFRLLQYAALAPLQRSVLQGWYDDLTRGTLAKLPSRSRLWVEVFYEEERIDDRRSRAGRKALAVQQTKKEETSLAPAALPKKQRWR